MSRVWTSRLYVIGLVLGMSAVPLIVLSFTGNTGHQTLSPIVNPQVFILGVTLAILTSLIVAVAWVGALLKMAQLQRWGWFVFLLLFSGIGLLGYVLVGPRSSEGHPHP